MIATALVFSLGALVATLLALLFVPFVWSRAQRLARREFDATIPTSVNEIRAEMDLVRATSAFDLRREERRARDTREQAARERAEAGRIVLENGQLRQRLTERDETLGLRDKRIGFLEERLTLLTGERDELHESRQELRARLQGRAGELEAFAIRHQELKDAFDEQRLRLAAAETRILQLTEARRTGAPVPPPQPLVNEAEGWVAAERSGPVPAAKGAAVVPALLASPLSAAPSADPPPRGGNDRLRAVLSGRFGRRREAAVPPAPLGNENAEIRERIADIAARVIGKEIQAEGENSPLRRMVEAPEPERANGAPSLAARVRALLAEPEPSPAPSQTAAPPTLPRKPVDAPAPKARAEAAAEAPQVSEPVKPPRSAAKRSGGGRSRPKSRR